MQKEQFFIEQTPSQIADRTFDRLSPRVEELSKDDIEAEVHVLWESVKNPALRQFIGPLTENRLLRRQR